MSWYSIRTESGEKKADNIWILHCPECDPPRTMEIEAVFPMTLWGGSIITYCCSTCGYRDDILVE